MGAIANVVIVGVLSLSLVLFIVWSWGRSEERDEYFDLMFAASVAGSLIMGFHMFAHDLSPLLLAMLLVMARIPRDGRLGLRVALWVTLVLDASNLSCVDCFASHVPALSGAGRFHRSHHATGLAIRSHHARRETANPCC